MNIICLHIIEAVSPPECVTVSSNYLQCKDFLNLLIFINNDSDDSDEDEANNHSKEQCGSPPRT